MGLSGVFSILGRVYRLDFIRKKSTE